MTATKRGTPAPLGTLLTFASDDDYLGQLARDMRLTAKIPMRVMAAQLRMSQGALSRAERGGSMPWSLFVKIACECGYSARVVLSK